MLTRVWSAACRRMITVGAMLSAIEWDSHITCGLTVKSQKNREVPNLGAGSFERGPIHCHVPATSTENFIGIGAVMASSWGLVGLGVA